MAIIVATSKKEAKIARMSFFFFLEMEILYWLASVIFSFLFGVWRYRREKGRDDVVKWRSPRTNI
jgi:hypothetical protein